MPTPDEISKARQLKANILYHNKELLITASKFDARASDIRRILDDGADINYQDEQNGYTPLMMAIDAQNERIAEYLLNQGANPRLMNKNKETAAQLSSSSSAIYQLLQEKIRSAQAELGKATDTEALDQASSSERKEWRRS